MCVIAEILQACVKMPNSKVGLVGGAQSLRSRWRRPDSRGPSRLFVLSRVCSLPSYHALPSPTESSTCTCTCGRPGRSFSISMVWRGPPARTVGSGVGAARPPSLAIRCLPSPCRNGTCTISGNRMEAAATTPKTMVYDSCLAMQARRTWKGMKGMVNLPWVV